MMKNPTILLLLSLGCVAFLTACSSNEGDLQDVVNDSTEAPTIEATTAPTAEAAIPTEASAIPVDEADASAVESFRNISYTGADFPLLDVYAPAGPGPWPVVVVVHGPGRGREAMKNLSETIAAEGAVVYNTSVLFPVHWDESIEQLACAVRFAQATAADYGADPGPVTLVGFASGAAIGAVVSLAGDDFVGDCAVDRPYALPKAFVGFEGLYDYASRVYFEFDHTVLENEDPELWQAINPYSHIGRNPDLQVRLIQVDDDGRARQVSIDFQQALADAGYDVMLSHVEGATHNDIDKSRSDAFQLAVQQTLEVAFKH